jgi:hypothetical protein
MHTMNDIYVEHATGRLHTVCTRHSDELLEPCWWKGQTAAPCGVCDVELLAEEIATVEGLSLPRAVEVARAQLVSLDAYARRWDLWVAAWHDPRVGRAVYA